MPEKNVVCILTEQLDPHADLMVKTLRERAPEVEVFRFHPTSFPEHASLEVRLDNDGLDASLRFYQRRVEMSRVRSVWLRRPQRPVLHQAIPEAYREWSLQEAEAALHGLFYSLDALVVNPFQARLLANNKIYQLRRATEVGFTISPTLVSNIPEAARAFHDEQQGEIVIKALSHPIVARRQEGRVLYTKQVSSLQLEGENGERIRHVPVQLQQLVKKEYELRVTVVGTQIFTAMLKSRAPSVDIRQTPEEEQEYGLFELPPEVERRCIELLRRLGLYYGAIDLLLTTGGEFIFLEINQSGQFYWIQRATGLPIMEALADLLVAGQVGGEGGPC